MEHLDRYEAAGMDDAFLDDVTEEERFAARLAAERELAERDVVEGRLTGRRRGLPAALEGAWLLRWGNCAHWGGRMDNGMPAAATGGPAFSSLPLPALAGCECVSMEPHPACCRGAG